MTEFIVVTFSDAAGRVIDVQTLKTRPGVKTAQITPTPFYDRKQAAEFERTLRAVSGLPATTVDRPTPKRKRVLSHYTGEIFPSAAAAARSIGVTTSAMTMHLRNPSKISALKMLYRFERVD